MFLYSDIPAGIQTFGNSDVKTLSSPVAEYFQISVVELFLFVIKQYEVAKKGTLNCRKNIDSAPLTVGRIKGLQKDTGVLEWYQR